MTKPHNKFELLQPLITAANKAALTADQFASAFVQASAAYKNFGKTLKNIKVSQFIILSASRLGCVYFIMRDSRSGEPINTYDLPTSKKFYKRVKKGDVWDIAIEYRQLYEHIRHFGITDYGEFLTHALEAACMVNDVDLAYQIRTEGSTYNAILKRKLRKEAKRKRNLGL